MRRDSTMVMISPSCPRATIFPADDVSSGRRFSLTAPMMNWGRDRAGLAATGRPRRRSRRNPKEHSLTEPAYLEGREQAILSRKCRGECSDAGYRGSTLRTIQGRTLRRRIMDQHLHKTGQSLSGKSRRQEADQEPSETEDGELRMFGFRLIEQSEEVKKPSSEGDSEPASPSPD